MTTYPHDPVKHPGSQCPGCTPLSHELDELRSEISALRERAEAAERERDAYHDSKNGYRERMLEHGREIERLAAELAAALRERDEALARLRECLIQAPHEKDPPAGCLCRWCKARRVLAGARGSGRGGEGTP